MATVCLKNICKSYDEVLAVADVSLTIDDGEFVVLVGPSGCGKSTTLRMIAGLEEVTKGELTIDGQRMNEVHPKDRDIAMVFQSYALYPHMNVKDNMSFGLKMRGMKKKEIEKKVQEAANTLGLADLLQRKPKELSGGQRQRVAMGRAIVRDPKVFLFDEPLSNLDAKLRVQMRAEIAKLHRQIKTTIIYVTHDQVEAMTLANRLVVMKDGVVQQVGTPLQVFEHPQNLFVAGFIGSPAMNFVDCQLEENGVLKGNGFTLALPKDKIKKVSHKGGPVKLGIRPNNFKLFPEQADSNNHFIKGKVDLVEPVGAETFVSVELKESKQIIVVRSNAGATSDLPVGQNILLEPDMNLIHLFDSQSQEAIF